MRKMGHCIVDIAGPGWGESRSNTIGKKTEWDLPKEVDHNPRSGRAERHQSLVLAIADNDLKPYLIHTSCTPRFLTSFRDPSFERGPWFSIVGTRGVMIYEA